MASLRAQNKQVGECALQFQISQVQKNGIPIVLGTKDVFVKGNQCKTMLSTTALVQSFIFNKQSDKAYILKDIGNSHFVQTITYPPVSHLTIVSSLPLTSDTTAIRWGYHCKFLQYTMSDSTVYHIEYTEELSLTVNEFEWIFKDIPGVVLAYTLTKQNGQIFKYEATKLDLSPLPSSIFNFNKEIYQSIDEK